MFLGSRQDGWEGGEAITVAARGLCAREVLLMPSCCSFLGCSLRPLDLEFMKHLSKVVNIIPVIAKADTMTLEEKIEFKQRVSISAPAWGPSLPRLGDGRHELYPSCWTAAQPPGMQSHRVQHGDDV